MTDTHDPKGLIREAFRIEGIDASQCRTIFLDWALGVPVGVDSRAAVRALLVKYAGEPQDHPMFGVLRAALQPSPGPGRRGGRAGRQRH